jgi:hypothetical protein
MKAAAVDVKVMKNPETGYGGAYEINKQENPLKIEKSADLELICIDKKNAVPPPILWPIADAKDKDGRTPMRLLVFHLLPLAASRLTKFVTISPSLLCEKYSNFSPPPAPPKCRLSLEFVSCPRIKFPIPLPNIFEITSHSVQGQVSAAQQRSPDCRARSDSGNPRRRRIVHLDDNFHHRRRCSSFSVNELLHIAQFQPLHFHSPKHSAFASSVSWAVSSKPAARRSPTMEGKLHLAQLLILASSPEQREEATNNWSDPRGEEHQLLAMTEQSSEHTKAIHAPAFP